MIRRATKAGGARVWVGLLPGLVVAAFLCVPVLFPPMAIQGLRLTLADWVFLREGGPMLGARAPREDIVILLADEKTHRELDIMPEDLWKEDIGLYALLLEQGARVVADTRLLFEDSPGAREVLEALVRSSGAGAVYRDIRAEASSWFAERREEYRRHTAHNHFHIDAGYDLTQNVRYYPLLGHTSIAGLYETMALKVARTALGLPPEIQSSGREVLVRAWGFELRRRGLLPAEADGGAPGMPDRRSYPLAPGRSVPWEHHPSVEAPTTVLPAALRINFVGPPGSFATCSYVDALKRRLPAGAFEGKIVIAAVPTIETYPVPSSASRRANTGEILANVVQNLLEGEFLSPQPVWQVLCLVAALGFFGGLTSLHLRLLPAIACLPAALGLYGAFATWRYRGGTFPDLLTPPAALVLSSAAGVAFRYKAEERARRRIHDLFGRYVPRPVVEELVRLPDEEARALRCTRREITVLFADIRGFTGFSETLPPEEVLGRLNAMLAAMVERAFRHQGTVDKFIGDAVMVLFNAPLSQEDHARRAVLTALEMQQALRVLEAPLGVGIGIHTGEAVVGNVGTPDRLEYTAIGSVVNLASRLCDSARGGEIVVSEATYRRVESLVQAVERTGVRVKGIDRELVTYVVSDLMRA